MTPHIGVKNPVWQGAVAQSLFTQDQLDYLNATVLGPPGVSNPSLMHDENIATRASITNTGNNQFILDLGSIAVRPLKAVVGQFRSPYSGGNNWTLDWSATSSTGPWTQVDTFNTVANGITTMDGGTPNFRWCRCKYQISFATWNCQAYMGTTNS